MALIIPQAQNLQPLEVRPLQFVNGASLAGQFDVNALPSGVQTGLALGAPISNAIQQGLGNRSNRQALADAQAAGNPTQVTYDAMGNPIVVTKNLTEAEKAQQMAELASSQAKTAFAKAQLGYLPQEQANVAAQLANASADIALKKQELTTIKPQEMAAKMKELQLAQDRFTYLSKLASGTGNTDSSTVDQSIPSAPIGNLTEKPEFNYGGMSLGGGNDFTVESKPLQTTPAQAPTPSNKPLSPVNLTPSAPPSIESSSVIPQAPNVSPEAATPQVVNPKAYQGDLETIKAAPPTIGSYTYNQHGDLDPNPKVKTEIPGFGPAWIPDPDPQWKILGGKPTIIGEAHAKAFNQAQEAQAKQSEAATASYQKQADTFNEKVREETGKSAEILAKADNFLTALDANDNTGGGWRSAARSTKEFFAPQSPAVTAIATMHDLGPTLGFGGIPHAAGVSIKNQKEFEFGTSETPSENKPPAENARIVNNIKAAAEEVSNYNEFSQALKRNFAQQGNPNPDAATAANAPNLWDQYLNANPRFLHDPKTNKVIGINTASTGRDSWQSFFPQLGQKPPVTDSFGPQGAANKWKSDATTPNEAPKAPSVMNIPPGAMTATSNDGTQKMYSVDGKPKNDPTKVWIKAQ